MKLSIPNVRGALVSFGRRASLLVVLTIMVGCASVKMPAPAATAGSVESLRSAGLAPAAAGAFVLAPGKPADMDRTLGGLRGSSVSAASGSFAQQLKEQLVADLSAAGLYDPSSNIIVEAALTDSRVDAAIGTGTGRLAARFKVQRAGKTVYDKELAAEAQWESSFVGAIALPAAVNQYMAFYPALTRKLFDDAEFRAALKK